MQDSEDKEESDSESEGIHVSTKYKTMATSLLDLLERTTELRTVIDVDRMIKDLTIITELTYRRKVTDPPRFAPLSFVEPCLLSL